MTFPERFSDLPDYVFPRLRGLLAGRAPGAGPVDMSIGEPRHPMPDFVGETLAAHAQGLAKYPPNDGTPELREAIAGWIGRRYGVFLDSERHVMALNGTREGLFNACLALCPERKGRGQAVVLIPNPFYQVYAVAARAAGAEPVYVPATAESGFLPNFGALDRRLLDRTAVCYLCSPANPQGSVASLDYWRSLLDLAEAHDFRIFADECYSEIWRDAPPPGALEAAQGTGADAERVVVFNSLSKRSNLPGLRSGFVAGGEKSLARLKQLRAYAGAPLPLPIQRVSERLWADEAHVAASLALYQEKFRIADEVFSGVLGYRGPEAGFFLWLPVEDGERAAIAAWEAAGVKVIPGAYLGRAVRGENPGRGYVRAAMVGPAEEVRRGLTALRDVLYG
jgi:aspartate/methionine/tyrosine aminotransferase